MPMITIPMPDEDLDFLRAYTGARGSTAEEFLARQAHQLRLHLQRPVHPEVTQATGIVQGNVEGETARRTHLEQKHA